MPSARRNNDTIRIGGLTRCCLETICEAPPGSEGDALQCKYEPEDGKKIRFTGGAWEWVHPRDREQV